MDCSKPILSAIDEATLANGAASELSDDDEHTMYQSKCFSVMLIASRTRPDHLVVASRLGSYRQKPVNSRMAAAKRAL